MNVRMNTILRRALLVFTIGWATAASAGVEILEFATPAQEEQYKTLIHELRCLVCQNQNLADSNADLAKDLRSQTYSMISQGKSNQEIIDYMVTRYGDFVLYRPPVKPMTLVLWIGPFVLLVIGCVILLNFVRRSRQLAQTELSEADRRRAERLLNEQEDPQQ